MKFYIIKFYSFLACRKEPNNHYPVINYIGMNPTLRKKIIMRMNLTFCLLISVFLQLGMAASAQRVTISERQASLDKIFKEINRQTGYNFLYTNKLLKNLKPISIDVKNMSVEELLFNYFKEQPINFSISDKTIVVKERLAMSSEIQRASIIISGKVSDDTGPISGVTVRIKGLNRGTVTDPDGQYKIEVPDENSVLQFSFMGYETKELSAGSNKILNVKLLQKSSDLNDLVVVGYGSQKRINLTGAVEQVGKELLENRPITRVSQALQGLVGNLNISSNTSGGAPNSTQSLNIRGYTGFGSRGNPLLVIDGVPGGDINSINPNDIENISVLKDQASSAIYGVDGAFGVILINTKQGKAGAKPQISYNNNISYSQLINIPKPVGSIEYVNIFNEAALNAGSTIIYPQDQIDRINAYLNGSLKTETQANASNTDWNNGQLGNANNNWFDILFKKLGKSQQHNIGVSGGSTDINYYIGLGYNDKDGMYSYGNDSFKRYNFRGNLGATVTNWMKINIRSSFSRSNADAPYDYPARTGGGLSGYMHQAARVAPVVPLYNPDGNLSNFSDPAWMGSGSRTLDNEDQTALTGEFVLNPLKGLNVTGNYSLFSYNNESSSLGKTFYIPKPDGSLATFGVNPNTFSRTLGKTSNQLINLFASYEHSLGQHNFKILGGYIKRFNESLSLTGSNSNLYTDNLPSLALSYNDKPIVSDAIGQYATEGYFTRLNYNYKEKFLIEFDGRYDATSRFITNRWQFYPGVSAGYVISNESFFRTIKNTVNMLKLRASYGQSGDQASFSLYPFYASLNTIAPAASNWFFGSGRQAYVSAPGVVNPDITWQKPVMLDFGFDTELLKNKLSLSFDWYRRTMKDMVVAAVPVPAVFGVAAPNINGGELETTGFELTVGWKDRIGQVKYGIKAVLSDYSGKVIKYPNTTRILTDYYEGQTLGSIWGYTSTGLYDSNQSASSALPASFWASTWKAGDVIYKDLDGSGRIDNGKNTADSPGDLNVIGNNTPRYAYSFNIDLSWKNFDFNAFIQGIGKRDVFINSNYFFGITGDRFQSSFFDIHRDRWTPDNLEGYFPKYYMSAEMAKNTQVQTRYLQNGAYLRFKNVQLGYSLPTQLINRFKISKFRLYASVENLATITKMAKSIDPELAIGDAKIYPLQRTFSFGVNVSL